MGIERDYLMRQLLMLFEVIQKILRYRKKGEKENAEDEIKYFYNILKIEADFESMNIEELMNYLQNKKKFTNEHLEMIAFVMKEQGELAENTEKQIDFFRKSYFILE